MNQVYLLEWDNGLDYDDHRVTLLGIYSSPEKMAEAREAFEAKWFTDGLRCWPFNDDGCFKASAAPLDTDLTKPVDDLPQWRAKP